MTNQAQSSSQDKQLLLNKMYGEEKLSKIKNYDTGTYLAAKLFPDSVVGTYPGDYFEANWEKPSVSIYRSQIHPDQIATRIIRSNQQTLVPVDWICYMIYSVGNMMEETLDEDWNSFGLVLGKKGDKVNPTSVLKITFVDPPEIDLYPDTEKLYPALYLVYYVFAPLRLNTNYPEYKNALAAKMTEALGSGAAPIGFTPIQMFNLYQSLANNATYTKLAAAFDMFLNRFPTSDYSKMRIGTIGGRFKDCSALKSFIQLGIMLTCKEEAETATWIWSSQVGADVTRITDRRSELKNGFGYGPYFSYMRMGQKSATSMSQNPYFHVYVHTIGSVLNRMRSLNAVMPGDINPSETIRIALVIGQVHSESSGAKEAFGEDESTRITIEKDNDEGSDGVDLDQMLTTFPPKPQGKDAHVWAEYFSDNHSFGVWDTYLSIAAKNVSRKTNLRDGSVGAYLKQFALDLLEAEAAKRLTQ